MRLAVFSFAAMLACSVAASTAALAARSDDAGALSPCQRVTSGVEEVAHTARQALLGEYGEGSWHGDSKWTVAGSVGTVTEASSRRPEEE